MLPVKSQGHWEEEYAPANPYILFLQRSASELIDLVALNAEIGKFTITQFTKGVSCALILTPPLICKHQIHSFNPSMCRTAVCVVHLVKI